MHIFNKIILRNRIFRKYKKTFATLLIILALYIFFPFKNSNQNDIEPLRRLIEMENDQEVNTYSYRQLYAQYSLIRQRERTASFLKYTSPSGRLNQTNQNQYLILQYTPIFGKSRLCTTYSQMRENIFLDECPFKNCAITCDHEEFNNSHAVLFHESDIANEIKRNAHFLQDSIVLHKNNPDKIFVLYNDEANPVSSLLDKIEFNWTMSFRLDAEISDCSYGCFYKKQIDDASLFLNFEEDFNSRNPEALWFVSNCFSKYRIDFANGLSEFIKLNVFGSCKSVRTLRKAFNLSFDTLFGKIVYGLIRGVNDLFGLSTCGRHSICEAQQFKSNKFYLSFESKNCSSYITEKFWRILRHNIIPGMLSIIR